MALDRFIGGMCGLGIRMGECGLHGEVEKITHENGMLVLSLVKIKKLRSWADAWCNGATSTVIRIRINFDPHTTADKGTLNFLGDSVDKEIFVSLFPKTLSAAHVETKAAAAASA